MRPLIDRMIRRLVKHGSLTVTFSNRKTATYGDGTGRPVHLCFTSRKAEWALLLDPEFQLGECYANGGITFLKGDIYDFLETVLNGHPHIYPMTAWMKVLGKIRYALRHFAENNVVHRAIANVQHHYDLTGALYDLFLDTDRQYSCAYYEHPDDDLETAQLAKKRHIAAKLMLAKPDLSVLDIGCGWGGMGLYLARHLEARVKGVTLSREQLAIACNRATDQKLDGKAEFVLQDYRHVNGQFDRIVSVGMFEHVGRPHYSTYFDKASALLKRDGVMLLHTIGRTDAPCATNPFIAKYIFPGGYIPTLSEMMPAIENSGLKITDIEILRLHYAETLAEWRRRFMARREEAKALYDERFCRIWEFYLAASESAFRWQNLVIFQIQMAHDQEAVPLTRHYIEETEAQLKDRERQLRESTETGVADFTRHAAE